MAHEPEDRQGPKITVRVFGKDAGSRPFSRSACVVRTSATAARLSLTDLRLRIGDVVGVQCGAQKAHFRVTSSGSCDGEYAGEVELVCLDAGLGFWTEVHPSVEAEQAPAAGSATPNRERRRFERYKCDMGALLHLQEGKRLWARCSDISLGGCYLDTWSPLPSGAQFRLELEGLVIAAKVSTCHPNVGMGVSFVSVSDPKILELLVDKLRRS